MILSLLLKSSVMAKTYGVVCMSAILLFQWCIVIKYDYCFTICTIIFPFSEIFSTVRQKMMWQAIKNGNYVHEVAPHKANFTASQPGQAGQSIHPSIHIYGVTWTTSTLMPFMQAGWQSVSHSFIHFVYPNACPILHPIPSVCPSFYSCGHYMPYKTSELRTPYIVRAGVKVTARRTDRLRVECKRQSLCFLMFLTLTEAAIICH